jgi:hypothetical protein
MQKYHNLLALSRIIRQKYNYIEQATGYHFNIFSILDRERYEVTTHSYFLYELLNPYGRHGQGSKFLKLFLEGVLKFKSYGDISVAKVERESLTRENRRIDFTIECENIIIGIEMKIDASDQNHQLFDYYEELQYRAKNKKRIELYYLTLDGKSPSSKSLNLLDKIDVSNISFKFDIYQWIKQCMQITVEIPIVREALKQYLVLIENLTGKKEGMVEELSEMLLQGSNLADAIALEKSIEKAKIKIQKRFWIALKNKLEGFEFVDFDFSKTDIDKKVDKYYELSKSYRYYGLKLDLYEKNEFIVSYYIELHNKLYHGLTISKKSNDTQKRAGYSNEDIVINIRENLLQNSLFDYQSSWWVARKHFDCSPQIDFYNFNEYTLQLNIHKILEESVKCLATEVIETRDFVKDLLQQTSKTY